MKAKTKFTKMYYKLPSKAREELVFRYYENPLSLNVVFEEVKNNTNVGKQILETLGYEDD